MNMMKACIIHGPYKAAIQNIPVPKPGDGEVLVRVERAGVCGTDYHIYKGEYIAQYPIIPGHEFSGMIEQVGRGVSGFKPGDRVTAEPNISCGHCEYCLSKRHNHCKNWRAVGVTQHGAMAEYVIVPQQCLFPIPDEMSYATAAFVEPMACIVHGMHQLSPSIGVRELLFGAGAMGQQLIQALVHSGVSELIVVDVAAEKLELAKQWGATTTLLSNEVEAFFAQEKYQDGVEIVVDCTGIPTVIENAFKYLGYKGTYLQFGVTAQQAKVSISPFQIFQKDWKIVGSMATNLTFQAALRWVAQGRIQLAPLVSRTISLEQLPELLAKGPTKSDMKVQVQL